MKQIDRIHMDTPFPGSGRIVDALAEQGQRQNRKRVRRLMQLMGIQAILPGPKTSTLRPQHTVYPYRLRGLDINRANQVWASDVTYIPMETGFVYLTVIMDWYRRKVLSWRVSNSLNAYEALPEARQSLQNDFRFYNQNRKYQTLKATPDRVYYSSIALSKAV